MKRPLAATRVETSDSGITSCEEMFVGGASIDLATCVASTRFSCARPACQFPSAMPAAQAAAARATAQPRGRKEYPEGMRYVVIAMLVLIVASLASALFYMLRGRDDPKKMARALSMRVGLSVLLFLVLMAGWLLGLWQPGRL